MESYNANDSTHTHTHTHIIYRNKLEMPKRVRRLERDGKMLNVNEGRYVHMEVMRTLGHVVETPGMISS